MRMLEKAGALIAADASEDDPTIRRCIGFAQREGFGSLLEIANREEKA